MPENIQVSYNASWQSQSLTEALGKFVAMGQQASSAVDAFQKGKGVGGTYPAADGTVCTNGTWTASWAGNTLIAASSNDFDGTASGVYDVRP